MTFLSWRFCGSPLMVRLSFVSKIRFSANKYVSGEYKGNRRSGVRKAGEVDINMQHIKIFICALVKY